MLKQNGFTRLYTNPAGEEPSFVVDATLVEPASHKAVNEASYRAGMHVWVPVENPSGSGLIPAHGVIRSAMDDDRYMVKILNAVAGEKNDAKIDYAGTALVNASDCGKKGDIVKRIAEGGVSAVSVNKTDARQILERPGTSVDCDEEAVSRDADLDFTDAIAGLSDDSGLKL